LKAASATPCLFPRMGHGRFKKSNWNCVEFPKVI